MTKGLASLFFVLVLVLADVANAQPQSGSQDSVIGGIETPAVRPRRDTYIIVPFPSPAHHGVTMSIQYYNNVAEQTELKIVDILDHVVMELQPTEMAQNGLHSFNFNTGLVATGTYFIRLTRYASDGSQLEVQDQRFMIVH